MHFLILVAKWGSGAITLVPDMLGGQARALSTREIIQFPKKVWVKFWPMGLASRARQNWPKKQKHPQFGSPSQASQLPKSKNFFNRTRKTCRIRSGFEQLFSYSGWRVTTKKVRAHFLAREVVQGNSSGTFAATPAVASGRTDWSCNSCLYLYASTHDVTVEISRLPQILIG